MAEHPAESAPVTPSEPASESASESAPQSAPDSAPDGNDDALADPQYKLAVVDLLGFLAYSELTAFTRLAVDSDLAPSQPLKASIAKLATSEFRHYELIEQRLTEMGVDPEEAMAPFIEHVDMFHERTKPSTWLEGLVKAYVGDGIGTDFYREVSAYVDASTRALVDRALEDVGQSDFVVKVVREATRADPKVAGPLALWGRRLVGEALSQAQAVAVERDALASLLVGGGNRPGADLAEIGRMFARLTDEHARRMQRLGLTA